VGEGTDVVVVGSGAAGCAAAYFLAKSGVKVTVLEQEAVASFASGFAAGLLNPLHGAGIPGPLQPLALEAFRMHARLAEELKAEVGTEFRAQVVPYMYVALADEEVAGLDRSPGLRGTVPGFPSRWLEGHEALSLEPRVSSRVVRAVLVEGLRQVDSYQYTLALLTAAERHGATLKHGMVTGIDRANGRIGGVVLKGAKIACEKIVLAMGPWSRVAERWLGVRMPVEPLRGQILRLRFPGPPLRHYVSHEGSYLTSKPDGLVWAGTTEEKVGFRSRPTQKARDAILRSALRIVPSLLEAALVLQTACLRPVTPDMLPIIGPVPGCDGVYVATGGGRKGILLSPAMGRAIADLITEGHTGLSISPFAVERFTKTPGG
jgi:glycine oxidase